MAASLLLVPGMGCDSSMWQAQLAYFGADAQIADITRSGTIQALAADVLRDAPERFALAGLSMGGIVAFEVWRQAPDRVSGMALLDTSYGAEGPERQLERDQQIERVRLQGISALKDLLISKLVPRYLVPGDTFALSEFDRIVDMGLSVGCDAFIRQNQALRDRPDSTDTLASISVPTLVLCGEYDQLCTVAVHRTMADAIPQAHLTVLEGCGHLSSMQCPDQVTQALKDWLVRCQ